MARAMSGMSSPASPVGVSAAAPALVVVPHAVHECVVEERPDDLGAEDGVLPHELPLVAVEAAGLEQHPVGHADLADVVQVGGLLDAAEEVLRPAELLAEQHHVRGHPRSVAERVVVLRVERRAEGLEVAEVHALDALVELGVVDRQRREAADRDDRRRLLRRVAVLLAVRQLQQADDALPGDQRDDEGTGLRELPHELDLGRREPGVVASRDDDRLSRLGRQLHRGPLAQREPAALPGSVYRAFVDAGDALEGRSVAEDVDVAHRSAGDGTEPSWRWREAHRRVPVTTRARS